MISRCQKCRPFATDDEIASIDLASESRNVQLMISGAQNPGVRTHQTLAFFQEKSGRLSRPCNRLPNSLRNDVMEEDSTPSDRTIKTVSSEWGKISVLIHAFTMFDSFWRSNPTIFPQGSFYKSPLANRRTNACSTTWHSVHDNVEIPSRFVSYK